MLQPQEVVTEHAQCAKLLHFLFQYYKYPTQGASFHMVARLCYKDIYYPIADNSWVDKTLLFIFKLLFNIELIFII